MATPSQQQPSLLQQIQSYGGTFSMFGGLAAGALSKFFIQPGLNTLATTFNDNAEWLAQQGLSSGLDAGITYAPEQAAEAIAQPTTTLTQFANIFGKALAVAGIVMGTISIFQTMNSMFKTGPNVMGAINVGMSAMGIAMGVNALIFHTVGMVASFTGPIGWAIAGAVIAVAILVSWLFGSTPPPEQIAAQNLVNKLSTVLWTAGPVVAVGLGTMAMLTGLPRNTQPPVMSTLTMRADYLARTLMATTGSANVPLSGTAPTVLVEPGSSPTDPEKVMIVTNNGSVDAQGAPLVTVQSFELYKNIQFVSSASAPVNNCYIPFFIKDSSGKPIYNPAVVNGMTTEQKLLESILDGSLSTPGSMSAIQLASAADKDCVDPTSVN